MIIILIKIIILGRHSRWIGSLFIYIGADVFSEPALSREPPPNQDAASVAQEVRKRHQVEPKRRQVGPKRPQVLPNRR